MSDIDVRREISAGFMRLLSYPEDVIAAKMVAGGEEGPFILVVDD